MEGILFIFGRFPDSDSDLPNSPDVASTYLVLYTVTVRLYCTFVVSANNRFAIARTETRTQQPVSSSIKIIVCSALYCRAATVPRSSARSTTVSLFVRKDPEIRMMDPPSLHMSEHSRESQLLNRREILISEEAHLELGSESDCESLLVLYIPAAYFIEAAHITRSLVIHRI
jgi:hypothetical protein